MERSWWWKAALYGAAIVLAVLYLVPTFVTNEQRLPEFFQRYFKKRIQLGLDLQGGLHLVYEVNIEKAVSSKVDRLANESRRRPQEEGSRRHRGAQWPRRHRHHLQGAGRDGQAR